MKINLKNRFSIAACRQPAHHFSKHCLLVMAMLLSFNVLAQQKADSLYVTASDGTRLFVKRSGSGYPVLFIHGGPGSNSYYFEKEGGSVFEKDVQLIYLDQRGCGRSDTARSNDYSLARLAKDFEEVRQALGYRQWIVMPHSFGGILATEYAVRYPEGIRAMVYLNCTINLEASALSGLAKAVELLQLTGKEKERLLDSSTPYLDRWMEGLGMLQKKGVFYKVMYDKTESFELDNRLMQAPFLKWHFGSKLWGYPEYFADFGTKTSQVQAPVLIVSGTRDYTIGPDHPQLMHFPKKQVRYVAGGHALYLEHNKELYATVSPFLKKWGR